MTLRMLNLVGLFEHLISRVEPDTVVEVGSERVVDVFLEVQDLIDFCSLPIVVAGQP